MLYVVRHGKKAELVTLGDELYFIHDEPEEFTVQKEDELRKKRNGLAGLTRWEDKVDFRAWLPLCPIPHRKFSLL